MLRPGDVVEVRSAAEILATLDGDAATDAMPFMPEMLQHAGRRFTVSRRAEKICDTVSGGPPRSLRMRDTVLLDGLRCDGSAHGGCQAGCLFYWKESWLRRVDAESELEDHDELENRDLDARDRLEALAREATRVVDELDGEPAEKYSCQATQTLRASEPLNNYDPRPFVRELTAGNVGPLRLLRVVARAVSGPILRRLRLLSWHPIQRQSEPLPTRGDLNLQPGDTVEVRSKEEIARTIDGKGKTRGLWFDWEMVPYCGGRYRVRDRVERIIDERTGRMIEIGSDCLILDNVVCSGECSTGHWLCPRASYPYWREAWLRRVDGVDPSVTRGSPVDATTP